MTTTSSAPSTEAPATIRAGAATSDYYLLDEPDTDEDRAVRDRVRASSTATCCR